MRIFIHLDEANRIDGTMPEFIVNYEFDSENQEYMPVESPNVTEAELEDGWFPWPLEGEPPEDHYDYLIVDGELVHSPPEPTEEELRNADVVEAYYELPEIRDGLLEVADMAASNEASLDDVITALMELAEIVGSE